MWRTRRTIGNGTGPPALLYLSLLNFSLVPPYASQPRIKRRRRRSPARARGRGTGKVRIEERWNDDKALAANILVGVILSEERLAHNEALKEHKKVEQIADQLLFVRSFPRGLDGRTRKTRVKA